MLCLARSAKFINSDVKFRCTAAAKLEPESPGLTPFMGWQTRKYSNILREDKKRNHASAARPANQITLFGNPDDIVDYTTLPNTVQMDAPPPSPPTFPRSHVQTFPNSPENRAQGGIKAAIQRIGVSIRGHVRARRGASRHLDQSLTRLLHRGAEPRPHRGQQRRPIGPAAAKKTCRMIFGKRNLIIAFILYLCHTGEYRLTSGGIP